MQSLRLDVPQATELAYELNRAGCAIEPDVLTEEECAQAVAKLFGKAAV